jgi:hypothetical protein
MVKFLDQTKLHSDSVRGNCVAACLASVLEVGIEEIPQFEDMGEDWTRHVVGFLRSKGLEVQAVQASHWQPASGLIALAFGPSPRGSVHHAVIWLNGKVLHDPHPSRLGLESVEYFWVIEGAMK